MVQKLAALNTPRILRDMPSPIKPCRCSGTRSHKAKRRILTASDFNLDVSHFNGRKWRNGEQLGHPQLKVEAEAVEKGPDVNQLTRAKPQGGDGESADGRQELLEDFIVIPANVVVNIPANDLSNSTWFQLIFALHSRVCNLNQMTLNSNTHLHSQSLMPRSKCLKKDKFTQCQRPAPSTKLPEDRDWCKSHVRLGKDVEHGDTLGRLRGVQVVQCSHSVDDTEHHGSFHPVIHQIGISQTSCTGTRGNEARTLLVEVDYVNTSISSIYVRY